MVPSPISYEKLYSVITPVYRNGESIPRLIEEFKRIGDIIEARFGIPVEFIFVIDRSPDASFDLLEEALPRAPFRSQLILHARNSGEYAALRTGLQAGKGAWFGTIAADLQDPADILVSFLEVLVADSCDIAVGIRESRDDPASSRLSSHLFWRLSRVIVSRELPAGGVSIFGCSRKVRDELVKLEEAHTSLIGLVFWLGFRRCEVGYTRAARPYGKSAWTLRKKLTYMLDSFFGFTDLPIRILTLMGAIGVAFAVLFGMVTVALRLTSQFIVPGYAATIIVIMFFGALNLLAVGLVGSYTWRAYENTKRRPLSIIQSIRSFEGARPDPAISNGVREPA